MASKPAQQLIVALDHVKLSDALKMARQLRGRVQWVKVGSVLFTAYGPETVERLRKLGLQVMLDLKFFDIPNTVELSCKAAAQMGVSLITVHASGGPAMLEAALRGAAAGAKQAGVPRPKILGVTVLTSMGGSTPKAVTAEVLRLAKRVKAAGCDGVVASAREARQIRKQLGNKLDIVCPGIRPLDTALNDQKRTATPAQALKDGASYLVVGRPITEAPEPKKAVQKILQEMEDLS